MTRQRHSEAFPSGGVTSNAITNHACYSQSTMAKTTGPYDQNFQQHLIDSEVYPLACRGKDDQAPPKPKDEEEIKEMLRCRRRSLSPSEFTEEEYEKFAEASAYASEGEQFSKSVLTTIIEGTIPNPRCRGGGIPFKNLASLTGVNLKPDKPDVYYGSCPEQLNRKVRDELSGYIVPSTQRDLPILPNFSLSIEEPDVSAAVARRRACYEGALGARAMHTLHSWRNDEAEYGNICAVSWTYQSGHLQMYAHHLAAPSMPGGRPEYHMTHINSWSLIGHHTYCREGIQAFRNARDWAAEQCDKAIKKANERVDNALSVKERHVGKFLV